jgi:hypothetical protein
MWEKSLLNTVDQNNAASNHCGIVKFLLTFSSELDTIKNENDFLIEKMNVLYRVVCSRLVQ